MFEELHQELLFISSEGNTRRLINTNPALPLSGPQRGSCLWLLHRPTKLCLPCPVYGLWLQGKGKEQDLVARALKPAVNRRERESFWYLSSSQSQLRNFLWWLRLRLGGLEHLAWRLMLKYAKVCKQWVYCKQCKENAGTWKPALSKAVNTIFYSNSDGCMNWINSVMVLGRLSLKGCLSWGRWKRNR